jgi:hypothetical protein
MNAETSPLENSINRRHHPRRVGTHDIQCVLGNEIITINQPDATDGG